MKKRGVSESTTSERSESSESNSEGESQQKQRKIGPEKWNSVAIMTVNVLPQDIDGLQAYEIKYKNQKDLSTSLNDGRKWNKNCPSNWTGHQRVRYADCKGSFTCTNSKCPYKIEYGVINCSQFSRNASHACIACGCSGEFVPCEARRYISYKNNTVKVYHYGIHSCPLTAKGIHRNKEHIEQLIKNNPKIKPSDIQSSVITEFL